MVSFPHRRIQVDCGSSEEQEMPPVSRNPCSVSKSSHHMPELPAQTVAHEEVMWFSLSAPKLDSAEQSPMAGSPGARLGTPLIILCFGRSKNTSIMCKTRPRYDGWVTQWG